VNLTSRREIQLDYAATAEDLAAQKGSADQLAVAVAAGRRLASLARLLRLSLSLSTAPAVILQEIN